MNKPEEHAANLSLHQGADHSTGVEAAQVIVGLPRAHKHNRLACDVSHGDGSTNLYRRKDDEWEIMQIIHKAESSCKLITKLHSNIL